MNFTPYMEISPNFEEDIFDSKEQPRRSATQAFYREGDILYLMGRTILCKYDISNRNSPRLICKADIAADHIGAPDIDYIRKESALPTAIVDIGDYLVISLRGGGGGVKNMADGVTVGNLSIVSKKTLEKVKEFNFENRVTFITKYKDILIVSFHFHGFYFYKITGDGDIISCIYRYIEVDKPRSASTREFQNSAVFEAEDGKINIAFATYNYGISVFTYNPKSNVLSPCSNLHPNTFPDMYDKESSVKNTVYGIASKGDFVYGGLSTGNKRFKEEFKDINWERFDKRGILYGPHNKLTEEHYHLELPDADKPEYVGAITGDPGPSFLCTTDNHLLFNLDKQGLGVAKIENDGKLTYVGRILEDTDGRTLTYQIKFDGELLYTSYKMSVPNEYTPPVFRIYKLESED